jgi:hypothetical protein
VRWVGLIAFMAVSSVKIVSYDTQELQHILGRERALP